MAKRAKKQGEAVKVASGSTKGKRYSTTGRKFRTMEQVNAESFVKAIKKIDSRPNNYRPVGAES